MESIATFNSKVFRLSAIIEAFCFLIIMIDSLNFYNDFFDLVYYLSVPFLVMNTIIFLYTATLEMKIDDIKRKSNKLTKTTV